MHIEQWFRLPRRLLTEFAAAACVLAMLFSREHPFTVVVFTLLGAIFVWRAVQSQLAVSRLQTDFLYALSHEVRTPLTSMRQLTEALVAGRVPSEERRQTYYEILNRESETMVRLVERLLDFGRLEAGVLEYRFEMLDAGQLISQTISSFQHRGAESGCTVEVENEVQGLLIRADRDALSRSLWNLLDKAVKHSLECKTIWVTARTVRNQLEISVRDKGVGIPKEDHKRIFNFFVRSRSSESAQVKGTGLGLAIVDILMQAHGGEVRLESEPGEGSNFVLVLPVKR